MHVSIYEVPFSQNYQKTVSNFLGAFSHSVKSVRIRSFSGPYFPVFSPNAGKYGLEKTPYLVTFHAVNGRCSLLTFCVICAKDNNVWIKIRRCKRFLYNIRAFENAILSFSEIKVFPILKWPLKNKNNTFISKIFIVLIKLNYLKKTYHVEILDSMKYENEMKWNNWNIFRIWQESLFIYFYLFITCLKLTKTYNKIFVYNKIVM